MDAKYITFELQRSKEVFKSLLENITRDVYLWKPKPDKWCLLEIVCHLYDEEREDFRARVKHIMQTPELPLPSINPVGWVTERKYSEQDYTQVLANFINERENSIQWLNKLEDSRWDNVYQHPSIGELSSKMIFTNWMAHDYLHVRQIIRLKYEYLKTTSGENLSYAGEW